jgi:hypothetical protein
VQAATSATTVHRRVREGEIIDVARRRYQRDRRFYPQEGLPDLIWQFAPPLVAGYLNDTGPAAFTVRGERESDRQREREREKKRKRERVREGGAVCRTERAREKERAVRWANINRGSEKETWVRERERESHMRTEIRTYSGLLRLSAGSPRWSPCCWR